MREVLQCCTRQFHGLPLYFVYIWHFWNRFRCWISEVLSNKTSPCYEKLLSSLLSSIDTCVASCTMCRHMSPLADLTCPCVYISRTFSLCKELQIRLRFKVCSGISMASYLCLFFEFNVFLWQFINRKILKHLRIWSVRIKKSFALGI